MALKQKAATAPSQDIKDLATSMQEWVRKTQLVLFDYISVADTTLNFGSIGAGSTASAAVTVQGAREGDFVLVSSPFTSSVGIVYSGFVSANDTVTLLANNVSAGSIDPPSSVYKVLVIKASP